MALRRSALRLERRRAGRRKAAVERHGDDSCNAAGGRSTRRAFEGVGRSFGTLAHMHEWVDQAGKHGIIADVIHHAAHRSVVEIDDADDAAVANVNSTRM